MAIDAGGKTGRRPGAISSRQAILDAARKLFTLHGYKGATVRAIAGEAGADPALIRHFFGDKDGLFVAAMALPAHATRQIIDVFSGPEAEWGERLTRAYLTLWEAPDTAAPIRATVVSAFTNEQALEQFRTFLIFTVLQPAVEHLPADNPQLRLTTAMSHLIGVAITRHLLAAPAIAQQSIEELVRLLAPTIQRYLTGALPQSSGAMRDASPLPMPSPPEPT